MTAFQQAIKEAKEVQAKLVGDRYALDELAPVLEPLEDRFSFNINIWATAPLTLFCYTKGDTEGFDALVEQLRAVATHDTADPHWKRQVSYDGKLTLHANMLVGGLSPIRVWLFNFPIPMDCEIVKKEAVVKEHTEVSYEMVCKEEVKE